MTDRKHSIECYDADCEWCRCWCHQIDETAHDTSNLVDCESIETPPGGATNTTRGLTRSSDTTERG